MVQKGDILYNPFSKETIIFIQTNKDSAGLLLQMDITIAPGGRISNGSLHRHTHQQEMISIKSGQIWATVADTKRLYQAGDSILIPAGTIHKLENVSQHEELHFICEMAPALWTETLYETAFALAQNDKQHFGEPVSFLQLALTLNKYKNHFYFGLCPVWLQKLLFWLYAPLGQLMGYRAEEDYKKGVYRKGKASSLLWN